MSPFAAAPIAATPDRGEPAACDRSPGEHSTSARPRSSVRASSVTGQSSGRAPRETAEACVAAGVARAHPFAEITPEALARMIAEVLGAPGMRRAAISLRTELAGLSGPARAAAAIAALGARAIWPARPADAAAPS